MEEVRLSGEGWSHGPILRARTFKERWKGLRGLDPGTSMLLETSSVHAFGLHQPFWAVGLTDGYEVSEIKMVRPGRVVMFPKCRYVIELPIDVVTPRVGARLEISRV